MKNHTYGNASAWRSDIDLKNIWSMLLKYLSTKINKGENTLRIDFFKKIDVNSFLRDCHFGSPLFIFYSQNEKLTRQQESQGFRCLVKRYVMRKELFFLKKISVSPINAPTLVALKNPHLAVMAKYRKREYINFSVLAPYIMKFQH